MNQEDYLKRLEQEKQAQAVKEAALFKFMTKDARERFRRVEMAHPGNAQRALMFILQKIQQGAIKQVDDNLLKKILANLKNKKEYNIINK
ncbi:hypothetical protein GF352_04535 [archaeon]|nr:hypothetical protein [archaeon]